MSTETAELTIEQRVAAGAAWLDENRPGWVEAIDLDDLDMDSCDACVLGQVFGNFWNAPISKAPAPILEFEISNYHKVAGPLGFSFGRKIDDDEEDELGADLDALEAEWRRLIESRRAEVE